MNINDVIELEIESMSFGPAAVARYTLPDAAKVVVFIEGAMPGEKVQARLVKKHKNYWEAELVKVVSPSPDRISPPCLVFDKCGGCQWQFMSYDAQVRAKKEILIHQLHRGARLPVDEITSKLTVHAAVNPFGYRARLQVRGDAKGLGFYGRGSHDVVYADQCLVAHADIQKAWTAFKASRPLAELAKATGQFKLEWTRTESGQVREALNSKHGAFGFTQINPEQNQVLVSLVEKHASTASGRGALVDLYGGEGNLSRGLASRFERVACVDSFNEGIEPDELPTPFPKGYQLVRARAEDFLLNEYYRDWGLDKIDCVIADPPRSGLQQAAAPLAAIGAERVVLVSCDPSTLARDLTAFTKSYEIEAIHLVDMFPQTYHLETVVSLKLLL